MLSKDRTKIGSCFWSVLAMLALIAGTGCGDDEDNGTSPDGGPFRLTYNLDASFQGPHGGQSIAIAIVRASDGSVVVEANGAVSATQDPSFTWSTGPVMEAGTTYEVHYWIDSNFGGGGRRSLRSQGDRSPMEPGVHFGVE